MVRSNESISSVSSATGGGDDDGSKGNLKVDTSEVEEGGGVGGQWIYLGAGHCRVEMSGGLVVCGNPV